MQLAALSCVLRQMNLREHLVWKLQSPIFFAQNLQLREADTRGVKVGRTKPQ